MAEGSHTVWPEWVAQPVICCECEQRVTLKQPHRSLFDEKTQTGRVWHSACDPFVVSVVVERRAA